MTRIMRCHEEQNLSPTARDHARRPRNQGPLSAWDGHARIKGPCGDTMEFWVAVRDGTVERAAFVTDGCGPSLAAGSMATCLAVGKRIEDAAWGDLDFLIIDSPPGTGDEPLSVCQLIGELDGAVVVTTPQKVAAVDVRKSITFCRQLGVPVLGVVENMNGFACPRCGEVTAILQSGGGRRIAKDMRVPFLGSIPLDPAIAEACDGGRAFIHHCATSPTAGIMRDIIASIGALDAEGSPPQPAKDS